MNKSELIEQLALEDRVTEAEADRFLNTLIKIIYGELRKDGEVLISGFGKFKVSHRQTREGINPRTFKRIIIPKLNTPKFVAGDGFKRAVAIKK